MNHASPVGILVVDDDQAICDICRKYLERDGFRVKTVNDAPSARKAFKEAQYQIVVIDVILPGENGIDLLGELRELDSDVCVIMLTGQPSMSGAIEGMKNYGAIDYLTKPIRLDYLRSVIQTAINKHGLASDPVEFITREVGRRIRHERKELNLTLRQLSKRIGLSTSLISQIERGESSPSIPTLYKVSVALAKPLHQLFEGF